MITPPLHPFGSIRALQQASTESELVESLDGLTESIEDGLVVDKELIVSIGKYKMGVEPQSWTTDVARSFGRTLRAIDAFRAGSPGGGGGGVNDGFLIGSHADRSSATPPVTALSGGAFPATSVQTSLAGSFARTKYQLFRVTATVSFVGWTVFILSFLLGRSWGPNAYSNLWLLVLMSVGAVIARRQFSTFAKECYELEMFFIVLTISFYVSVIVHLTYVFSVGSRIRSFCDSRPDNWMCKHDHDTLIATARVGVVIASTLYCFGTWWLLHKVDDLIRVVRLSVAQERLLGQTDTQLSGLQQYTADNLVPSAICMTRCCRRRRHHERYNCLQPSPAVIRGVAQLCLGLCGLVALFVVILILIVPCILCKSEDHSNWWCVLAIFAEVICSAVAGSQCNLI